MTPKLALYSDQNPPTTDVIDEALLRWLPRSAWIGYLPSSPDRDREWFRPREVYYARYGFRLEFFGLEDEFDPDRTAELFNCDALHLSGGNTFQFLYWLRERGLVEDIRSYVAKGGVLIGVSAGSILMTPDIGTSLVRGDILYPGLTDLSGLALVDFDLVPHFDGSASAKANLARVSRETGRTAYGLSDASAILVEGTRVVLKGPFWAAIEGSLILWAR